MIAKPKGTKDVLPSEVYKWHYVENTFRETCLRFGFREVRTPLFEYTKLFKRGVGETTDIVNKEMYSVVTGVDLRKVRHDDAGREAFFKDLDNDGFTLKPEGTAPVVRSFVENKIFADAQPSKMYYITPCFRHERPQAGRLRQFHQFGIEVFGSHEATADAEVIALADSFLREVGITGTSLEINSVGCPKCRPVYHEALKEYLKARLDKLCSTCDDRYHKNPMRILDCKVPSCQEVLVDPPLMIDYLCEECQEHFEKLKAYLTAMEVAFVVNPKIVRGLDYYTKTAFEFVSGDVGAQSTLCGGGRYDGLVEQIDGPATPGVGFGLGIERLLLALENTGKEFPKPPVVDIYIAAMGDDALVTGMNIVKRVRMAGLIGEIDHLKRSFKAQFKFADKLSSKYVMIIGEDEVKNKQVSVKNMETGEQSSIPFEGVDSFISTMKNNQ